MYAKYKVVTNIVKKIKKIEGKELGGGKSRDYIQLDVTMISITVSWFIMYFAQPQ